MKIEQITIRNLKRFENLTVEFKNEATNDIANQFLILGDNGTGKTTVLQAIALCLSLVCGRIRTIQEFDWMGWLPGRYWRWGTPSVELVVRFSADEVEATREAARRWYRIRGKPAGHEYIEPAGEPVVRVGLEGESYWAGAPNRPFDAPTIYQFRGRFYAASILAQDPSARELFERLPGIFWFDQFRNLATAPGSREAYSEDRIRTEPSAMVPYSVGVTRLREYLNRWKLQHLQGGKIGQVDFLLELENHYKRIFPGRSFGNLEPMYQGGVPSPSDYYFMLNDGNRTYDIEEMSSGEQSVFPMLYEFVRQRIRNSVVLIDEIDLNLHPPLAQGLLASLPQLGPNCQFLYTSHSRAISELVSPHEIYRLKGGRPCL